MVLEQSGQTEGQIELLPLPAKALNSMLFQGEKDMREMLGEGPFYKELGIYKYNREFLRKMLQTIMHIGVHI